MGWLVFLLSPAIGRSGAATGTKYRIRNTRAVAIIAAFFLAVSFVSFPVRMSLAQTETAAAFIEIEIGAPGGHQRVELQPGSGESFSDCPPETACPRMVVVPASGPDAKVGSPENEPQRLETEALHAIDLKPFAIGQTEVSVREYSACVDAGACRHPEWSEPGGEHNVETGSGVTYKSMAPYVTGPDQPVVGISWHDAAQYAKWLSQLTGRRYRLPSETEWEYAARAGAETAYWWGAEAKRSGQIMACCEGCGSELDRTGLFPVRAFEPNPWGLYQVHGNAWEWVADYFCEDYSASQSDGTARITPQCPKQFTPEGLKVFRGGSCFYGTRQMRASMRLRNAADFRNMTIGFRVARDLE